MTAAELAERGWDDVDVVFVTGDAYVDHPSFAMAILSRVLEAAGYRVALLAQPDWHSCDAWRTFGRPRLFFAISAGNMDSMLNHYTANRKVRNDNAYSPGGRIGLCPDRATLAYCQRAREAYKGVPIIAGGVEASLRRFAHYDYWSDTVKRSIILDAKADLVVFGMGESALVEIARRLEAGESVHALRDLRGVAYALGAKEEPPGWLQSRCGEPRASARADSPGSSHSPTQSDRNKTLKGAQDLDGVVMLPSYEEVKADRYAFAEATRLIHQEANPYHARILVQPHDRQAVVCNPPRLPEAQSTLDSFYDLPYTRRPHPSYREPIPAYEMIKDSITIMRGCFGGCTFCSLTSHQGRIVQSRSRESVVREISSLGSDPKFKGTISDVGGPTANLYMMRCGRPEIEARCRRLSCLHPKICPLLTTNHAPLIELMRAARSCPGVRNVLVASGIRMDVALRSPEYLAEVARHHVGGHLKVAPEHINAATLNLMKKPERESFLKFARQFEHCSRAAGKEQYLVPYFMAGHPGCDLEAMIELALFLKRTGYRPEQVQDFIPAPLDVATCMYHTGLDPFSREPVYVPRKLRERKLQRSLLQFFMPENYFMVREALQATGRSDLIGSGPDCLIPARPPAVAVSAQPRRRPNYTTHPRSKGPGPPDRRS